MPHFRKEATQARRQQVEIFGDVILTSTAQHRMFAIGGALLGTALLLLLIFGQYSRRVSVAGQLLPEQGVVRLYAQSAGVVRAVPVRDGQMVAGGAVLLRVANPHYDGQGEDADRGLQQTIAARRGAAAEELHATPTLQRQEAETLQTRQESLARAQASLLNQVAIATERGRLAEEEVAKFAQLKATGYVSPAQHDVKRRELLDQQLALAGLQKQLQDVGDERLALQRQQATLPLQQANARSAMFRTLQEVEHELLEAAARREFSVVAPVAGKVTALTAKPGSLIAAGQVLGALVPEGAQLQAILYVPSHGIGFIEPGARVSLRYRAYPYQKYGQATGIVSDVSAASLRPDELDNGVRVGELAPGLGEAPVYRVRVRLASQQVSANGKRFDLLPGALLDADIVLDRKALYQWILDPLDQFSASLRL